MKRYDNIIGIDPDIPKQTNQEIRDTVLLAWHQAGLVIKI